MCMTLENRIVFDLAEVRRIILECHLCGAQIAIKPGTMLYPPQNCPNGHAWNWNRDVGFQSTNSPHRAFFGAVPKLQEMAPDVIGFKMFLELESPRLGPS